jgi:hypothetical protein
MYNTMQVYVALYETRMAQQNCTNMLNTSMYICNSLEETLSRWRSWQCLIGVGGGVRAGQRRCGTMNGRTVWGISARPSGVFGTRLARLCRTFLLTALLDKREIVSHPFRSFAGPILNYLCGDGRDRTISRRQRWSAPTHTWELLGLYRSCVTEVEEWEGKGFGF